MNIQVVSFDFRDKEYFEKAVDIRNKVFIQEKYLDKFLEFDGLDRKSTHYLICIDENPVGTARWRTTYDGIKIERFAIIKSYRNKKIGQKLLNRILKETLPLDMDIYLEACISAVKFFEKSGFTIEGKKFIEANVEHYKMIMS